MENSLGEPTIERQQAAMDLASAVIQAVGTEEMERLTGSENPTPEQVRELAGRTARLFILGMNEKLTPDIAGDYFQNLSEELSAGSSSLGGQEPE